MIKTPALAQINEVSRNLRDRLLDSASMVVAGVTPFEVVYQTDICAVRFYRSANKVYRNPVVIVSPLAVNMLAYDIHPERSFIKALNAGGFDVYLIDWGKPTRKQASYTLVTYIKELLPKCLDAVRAHSGEQQLNLHGWSMGGGMSLVHAAFSRCVGINSIITLGTPIDGHSNGAAGRQYKRLSVLLKKARINLRKIPAKVFYTPGWANVIGFKLLDPVSAIRGYVDLLKNLHDRDYVAQHANQAAFIEKLEAYPGGALRDWFCTIWMENETAHGRFTVGKEVAHLRDVTAPVLCIAGKSDALSNVPCSKALLNVVGSTDKEFFVGPGGHIGIVSGKDAPDTIWTKTLAWLGERSVAV